MANGQKISTDRKINKKKTLQNILDWASSSIGHSIDIAKLNKKMKEPDYEEFLVEAAAFCKTEVVYH